jgi:hypothetical protein
MDAKPELPDNHSIGEFYANLAEGEPSYHFLFIYSSLYW